MGRIQASTGLISGIPSQDIIDKLLALSARPRDTLSARIKDLQSQKLAVTELTALVIGVQFAMQRLGTSDVFAETSVSTTNDKLLAASITGIPVPGSYQYTPVRQAQAHQLLSQGFASKTAPLGAGTMTLQFGGFVDQGMLLDELNGGAGVQRGKIKITDRSGTSAVIDLRFTNTIEDVLDAINENGDVRVKASVDGDQIKLVDLTGETSSNLIVQEVAGATTAADLGLSGVNVSANEVTGQDIVRLYEQLALQRLNDGNGVNLRSGVADLQANLADGTSLDIDFFALKKGPTASSGTTTAKNGDNAQISITSTGTGETFDGYKLVFEDDTTITAGNEKVSFNAANKTFTVKIDAGNTRAAEVIAKLNADSTFSASFTAANGAGNGTGVVDVADTLTTAGGAIEYYNELTLGDLMDTINRVDPTKLVARISASGESLELVDLTVGSNTFSVSSLFGGSVAEDLGFNEPSVGGVITGERRLSGLKTVLLDTLAGGAGLGPLGMLSITNRNGAATNVDLATAKTLEDVIRLINDAAAGVTARVNDARNGILLSDTTGGVNNLIISNGDATNTATKLKIAVNAAQSSVNSGSLGRQMFNESLTLASLRNGRGIGKGSFLITNSQGVSGAINMTVLNAKTVGDVINGINALGIGVTARINDNGDGLLLTDTAGGAAAMTVADVGSGTAAKDLKIAGTASTPAQTIEGSYTVRLTLDADDSLQDLVNKINAADAEIGASLIQSGTGSTPYRFTLNSRITGSAGEMLVDASGLGITFQQTIEAQDAMLVSGSANASVIGAVITSSTNDYENLIDGVKLTIEGATNDVQTVTISKSADDIVSKVKLFVDQYNKVRDKVEEVGSYNPEDNTAGILFSSSELLQIDLEFGSVMTSRYFFAGSIQSWEQVGISLDANGQLQFDEEEFREKYDSDGAAVEQFFTTAGNGAAAKVVAAAERLTGKENSVLMNRSIALQTTIDNYQETIADMTESLDRQRELMVRQFAQLETVISNMQMNLSWISKIQPFAFASASNNSK